ncbi:MAG: hypothetical protein HWD86_01415 [Kangiellaceae bacterium]|nr:hypothetical protein [Kangiellaceae bacterium]
MKQLILICCLLLLSACSTRQVVGNLSGSTEQRLVTYSVEKLIASLPQDDFAGLTGQKVFVKSHFIKKDEVLEYAHQMLQLELMRRFGLNLVSESSEAMTELHFFYTSLGTDTDTYGLTIPLVNLSDTSQSSQIDILAVDMYHGISEFMYYIKDNQRNQITKKRKILSRVKTDKFSTPILSFPLSDLDENEE